MSNEPVPKQDARARWERALANGQMLIHYGRDKATRDRGFALVREAAARLAVIEKTEKLTNAG